MWRYSLYKIDKLFERRHSMRHDRWMNLASKMAQHSELNYQLGAVMVRSGNVLSTGFNKQRNAVHNCSNLEEAHIHAEMDALARCSDPNGATLYVSRIVSNEKKAHSMPCHRCAYELQEAGVEAVVYVNEDGENEKFKFKGQVENYKPIYEKANRKFNKADTFAFRGVFYNWVNLI